VTVGGAASTCGAVGDSRVACGTTSVGEARRGAAGDTWPREA
jgi:hypothetical protein